MSAAALITDPFQSALTYSTAPYAQGDYTQDLVLEPAIAGLSNITGYTFSVFQSRYGVQTSALSVSYIITLLAPLGNGPVTLEVAYINDAGAGIVRVSAPEGTLPGSSFVIPTPAGGGLVLLETVQELPAPASPAASGPGKWRITALLGNTARLLSLLLGQRQQIAATAQDVCDQRHLLTARGGSLDRIGEALAVARLLPSPYRLDLDTTVIALYHLDDAIAPVIDATGSHPGQSWGAQRGVGGRIGSAAQITAAGGITIPDDDVFAIPAGASFTVEMYAQLQNVAPNTPYVLAVKRPNATDPNAAGWALTLEASGVAPAISFSVTDRAGTEASVTTGGVAAGAWFHVAGVVDGGAGTLSVFFNGALAASASSAGLIDVQNCADIGLGTDRTGAAMFAGGLLDEVRFSNIARADFSAVIAGQPYQPDGNTVALYHLDETDDLIDEATAQHFGLNRGATRGVPARFGGGVQFTGDPLPEAHCAAEAQFQNQLRTGTWDQTQGGARVTAGPYTRFGYKQGAISVAGLTGQPEPVMVNDSADIDASTRGLVTTACYGFVPADLPTTISAFEAAGRSVQEAIDYFGEWNGEPDSFYTTEYANNGITAVHETCQAASGSPTSILISGDPGLVIDAGSNLTVEAIIRPDAVSDDYPRAIAASRSSGLREGEANAGEAGWALSVCGCDCIPNNLQWTLGDSAGNLVNVIAGLNLADGSFHHVAGVLDRDNAVALLFVDGVEVGKEPIGALAEVATAADVTLGNDPALDAPYAGRIDEVRLSRAARRAFYPVLGESDDRYRQRLAIYAPWRMPSWTQLQRGVRALSLPTSSTADEIAGTAAGLLLSYGDPSDAGQLDILEADSTRFCASQQFRILPARLAPGQSIASDGTSPADETADTGTYTFFQEALVREGDGPGLSFPAETDRWMILRTAQGLEALAGAVQAISPATQIVVQDAWSSTTTLHSQGRSLDIAIQNPGPGIDLGLIAAMAHQAGVDYVGYDVSASFVRLSFAAGSDLDLTASPAVIAPGQTASLTVPRPAVANPAALSYRLIRCGMGDGDLSPNPNAGAGAYQFTASALGTITVVVEYPLSEGGTLSGSCTITIAPTTLDGCTTIDNLGDTGVTETDASGAADTDFSPAYLITSNVISVNYASATAHQMQLPLDTALGSLAALVAAEPGAPQMTVLAAYDPTATNLQAVGRGLVVAPSSTAMTAARLGALAYRAGFSYIERRRYPASVYASVEAGPRFRIVRTPLERLWANARISGLGEFMATEFDAAGPPDPGFTTASLQTYANPVVTFDAGVSNQVQATLATALNQLVALLQADGIATPLEIVAGFNPAASDLTSVGRAVLIRNSTVTSDRLSGYALAAGFGFIQNRAGNSGGPAVYAAAYAANSAPPNVFTGSDLIQNVMAELSVEPQLPITGALDWCIVPCCGATATLSTALPAPNATGLFVHKIISGSSLGAVTIDASFSLNDAAQPYQFVLQPRSSDSAQPKLTKDQYDDLLNFVSNYCPVGVEAVTRQIRDLVYGFVRPPRWNQLPTDQTFLPYRLKR